MPHDPAFSKLEEEVYAFLSEKETDSDAFTSLALRIHRFQRETLPGYGDYCNQWCSDPQSLVDIVPIPALVFKRHSIHCFPSEDTLGYFQTSGTTEAETGKHFYHDLRLYRQSAIPCFKRFVLPDIDESIPILSLTPPPIVTPHSSLVCMIQMMMETFGTDSSGYFLNSGNQVETDKLLEAVAVARSQRVPVLITTTAFSLVHILDELAERRMDCKLPRGSRIMETGGFKGRSREVSRDQLYRAAATCFDLPLQSIVNEYGMTELFSQFYDTSLVDGRATDEKLSMPWLRAILCDPWNGKPTNEGAGVIKLIDLANVGSCIAVQTEDAGEWQNGRLRVLGRVSKAEIRGCSLSVERMGA